MKRTDILKIIKIGLVLSPVLVLCRPAVGAPPPENGTVREYYQDGRARVEFRYKDGNLARKRAWYRNGRLMCDYVYRGGEPFRKKDFYENGRIKAVWTKKTGVLKVYNSDGSVKAAISGRSDGLFIQG